MKELQIFNSPQFGQIRVAGTPDEPLFRASDICTALGHSNPRKAVADHVDEDDVTKRDTIDSLGRTQQSTFINESGLYALIFGSKLESAKAFKRWVTSEVLPAIRKTGGYMAAREDETPEQIMARALLIANDTIGRMKRRAETAESKVAALQSQTHTLSRENTELQYCNDSLTAQNDALGKTIDRMRPAAVFAKAISASPQSVLVKELSVMISQNKVGIKIGQNRLFGWLRDHGYLCSVKGERFNLPTQKSIDMGLIEVKKSTYTTPDGGTFTNNTPRITGKGQVYFVNRVLYDLVNEREYNERNGQKGGEA